MPSATHQNFVLLGLGDAPDRTRRRHCGDARNSGSASRGAPRSEQGLEWLRSALEAVLEARGLAIDPTLSLRIAACSNTDVLRRLIAEAATATSAAELFEDDRG